MPRSAVLGMVLWQSGGHADHLGDWTESLVGGFINPATVYSCKELEFQKDVLWWLIGHGAGLMTAIPLAFIYRNVWALVLSVIAAQLASTLASYWLTPYWPRFKLGWPQVRELIYFGKWVFWSRILVSLKFSLDSLIIGKIMGATALGFYRMAHHLAILPTEQIGLHTYTVIFSAFSKLQKTGDCQCAFLQTLTHVSLVVIPIGCFLTVLSELLIWLVLGEPWASIAPTFRMLVWAGVATAITGATSAFLLAIGKPSLFTRTSQLRLITWAGLLYPMVITLGTTGVGLAVATSKLRVMLDRAAPTEPSGSSCYVLDAKLGYRTDRHHRGGGRGGAA